MQTYGKDGGNQQPSLPLDQPEVTQLVQPVDHLMGHPAPESEPVQLDEAAKALIGHHLKVVYSEIVEQPIPEHLLELLDDLERKERER